MSDATTIIVNETPEGEILLGKYCVERVLGRGGMGIVLAARHIELDELFAIKLLGAEFVNNERTVSRFLREARAAARLTSEHVARVHDVGRLQKGTPYMIMEYLKGADLAEIVESHGPLPLEGVAYLLVQACDAIAEAHALGIFHRDIKPSNLFLTHRHSGKPCLKLLDFGISKQADSDEQLTRTGVLVGSPQYMSPEQIKDPSAVDARTDIWALGVVLCKLTTGKTPFRAEGLHAIIAQILTDEPELPSQLEPGLPRELDEVVARCLRKDRNDRYATIDELAEALRRFVPASSQPTEAMPMIGLSQIDATDVMSRGGSSPSIDAPSAARIAAAGNERLELPNGIVNASSPYYVTRPLIEEACLREVLKPGALVRIKGPRQMGKTSLMMRILGHADNASAQSVTINLQMADSTIFSDLDRFLRWICAVVGRRLKKRRVDDVWDGIFGAKDNCTAYLEDQVLADGAPFVLALDNVDRVFECPGTAEEFFSLLRAWHEMGKGQGPWHALRLVLAYSTEMYVPMSINRSPFNVGLPVALGEWNADQVKTLAKVYRVALSGEDIDELMSLLGGHPHLIRITLYHLANGMKLRDVLAKADTDEGLFADHLKHLLWQLERQPDLFDAATRVLAAPVPVRLSTELAFKLVSLGLARLQGNDVLADRELYRRYLTGHMTATR